MYVFMISTYTGVAQVAPPRERKSGGHETLLVEGGGDDTLGTLSHNWFL